MPLGQGRRESSFRPCGCCCLEALALVAENPDGFDLVITDMTMPLLTGDELLQEITSLNPGLPVVICTGYSEQVDEEKAGRLGAKGFLLKPVLKNNLTTMLRSLLDSRHDS